MDNDDDQDDDDDIWIIEFFPRKKNQSIENGWSVSEDFVSLSFASVFFDIQKRKHSNFLIIFSIILNAIHILPKKKKKTKTKSLCMQHLIVFHDMVDHHFDVDGLNGVFDRNS